MHRHHRKWWGALTAGLLAACTPSPGPDVDSAQCAGASKPLERASLSRVKDINPRKPPPPAYERRMSAMGGTAFFAAPGAAGIELWKSDGTEAGTIQVKDLQPGSRSSSPRDLVELNGALYFLARSDSEYRDELWKSNGTQAGTERIMPLPARPPIFDLWVLGGRLYFTALADKRSGGSVVSSDGTPTGTHVFFDSFAYQAEDAYHQQTIQELFEGPGGKVFLDVRKSGPGPTGTQRSRQLWVTDGTKAGTVQWAALALPDTSSPSGPEFARVGEALFFRGLTGAQATLWKTEGAQLTAQVKAVNPTWLTPVGGTLFFRGQDGSGGTKLWRSDGTEAGTVPVKDVVPTALRDVGGRLFFEVRDAQGVELWTSDGTEPGTVPLGKFVTVASALRVRGTLVFTANDGVSGVELWKSDGTQAGTVRVKDISPGAPGSQPSALTEVDGTLFFRAEDGTHGAELWKSDGTEPGTVRVKDIAPGATSARPSELLALGRTLLFQVDGEAGLELWKSDGTETGTVRVRAFIPWPTANAMISENSYTDFRTAVTDDALFFTANDGESGRELWKTDGTEAGTARVKDFTPGLAGTAFGRMEGASGTVLVATQHGFTELLWKSDGTEAGTVPLSDAVPELSGASGFLPFHDGFLVPVKTGTASELWKTQGTRESTVRLLQQPGGIAFLNSTVPELFYTGSRDSSSWVLWRTDGTEAGTVQLSRPEGSTPGAILEVHRRASDGLVSLLTYNDAAGGLQLWRVDAAGPRVVLVKDLLPNDGGVDPSWRPQTQMMAAGGKTFFVVTEVIDAYTSQRVLWTTDGTEAGTVRLGALPRLTYVFEWLDVGGTLYLQLIDNNASSPTPSLWKSDGTVEGTGPLRTFKPGTRLAQLVALGGKLFFTAKDDEVGAGLWRSDGTPAGTVRVKALVPIPAVSSPGDPGIRIPRAADVLGDALVFSAARPELPEDQTLWISDGTEAGTVPLAEEGKGREPLAPLDFVRVGSTLFFHAEGLGEGRELWSLRLKDIPGGQHCDK